MSITAAQVTAKKREAKKVADVLNESLEEAEFEFYTNYVQGNFTRVIDELEKKNLMVSKMKQNNNTLGNK